MYSLVEEGGQDAIKT